MVVPRTRGKVAVWVEGSAEQSGRLNMAGPAVFTHGGQAGRDDEEFGRDEVELGGEGEEAGVQRRLGLGLLEGFAGVEICMGEDPAKAAGE